MAQWFERFYAPYAIFMQFAFIFDMNIIINVITNNGCRNKSGTHQEDKKYEL